MLIKFKVKSWMAICYLGCLRFRSQQVLDMLLYKQGAAEDSHDLVDISVKFHFMFDYCDDAVSAYSRIDLYSDGCLGVAPECGNSKVLFDPFEEKLHLPSVLVKEYNLFGRQEEIICVKDKTSLQVGDIRYNTSYPGRVIGSIASTGKPYGIVLKNVSILGQVQTVLDHKFRLSFLSYDKEGSKFLNFMKSLQVPVSTVEDMTGQRFIINDIHRINIMNRSICDVYHNRNLSHYIKLGVQFNAGLGASELCPVINTHAKINRGGIERVDLAADTKFPVYTRFLSQNNHMVGELFEHMPVAIGIASGENITVYRFFAKAEMKGFPAMCCSDICEFTETSASEKLTKHKDKQLSPIRQLPSEGSVLNLVFGTMLHDSFKFAFWQKVNNLAENVSSCIHEKLGNRVLRLRPQYNHLKSATRFSDLKIA